MVKCLSNEATQEGAQLKTYKLFLSRILYLIFSEHSWLPVTETLESETADKGAYMCFMKFFVSILEKIYLLDFTSFTLLPTKCIFTDYIFPV